VFSPLCIVKYASTYMWRNMWCCFW
jgi:hypothetical protein